MRLLVDCYNVLHSAHALPSHHSLSEPDELGRLIQRSGWRARACLVCDGTPPPHVPAPSWTAVRVLYAGKGREADDLIEHLIEADSGPRDLTVVSNDRRVRAAGRRRRASIMSSEAFLRSLASAVDGRTRAARGEEKPERPADPDGWLEEFGYARRSPRRPSEPEVRSETEAWLRAFGFKEGGGKE